MTDREKLVALIRSIQDYGCKTVHEKNSVCTKILTAETVADYLIANGVTVQLSPQNNHRKICPTTGLECIECVPGSPCANLEKEEM